MLQWPWTIQCILLLLHKYNFATVMNCNVKPVFSNDLRELLWRDHWTHKRVTATAFGVSPESNWSPIFIFPWQILNFHQEEIHLKYHSLGEQNPDTSNSLIGECLWFPTTRTIPLFLIPFLLMNIFSECLKSEKTRHCFTYLKETWKNKTTLYVDRGHRAAWNNSKTFLLSCFILNVSNFCAYLHLL